MTLKNRLYIAVGITVVLVVVLVSVGLMTSNRADEQNEQNEILESMQIGVAELDIVTYDYLLYREERMEQQWNMKYESLGGLLEGYEKEERLESVRAGYVIIGDLFSQITVNYEERQKHIQEGASPEEADTTTWLENRLVGQLLITSNSMMSDISRMAEEALAETVEVQRKTSHIVLIIIIVIGIALTTLLVLIIRSISKPLSRLADYSRKVGKGEYGAEIEIRGRDEIAGVASDVKKMVGQLLSAQQEVEKHRAHLDDLVKERTAELETEIAEHKETEEALKESGNRFRTMFDSMGDGVAIYKAVNNGDDFVFADFNKAGEEIENIKREELIGKSVIQMFPGIKESGILEVFQRVWATGKAELHPVTQYKDDRIVGWRENYIYKLPSGEIVAIYEDATERKKAEKEKTQMEQQLQQSQKLESIGQLAGGVAHDLNNMLTPILGFGQLLLEKPDEDEERREQLEEIMKAGWRARDLVRQLLAFSRKQTLEFKTFDLNTLLMDFSKLLRSTIREDIVIKLIPAKSLPLVSGDTGQLEQVIMNLAVNAQDAMPDGGELTIETTVVKLDESYAAKHVSVIPGPYVMLAISDTGCGMDEKIREQIFDPFFTTKSKDKGTGLGLATVYGIVKQHNGNIWVYSEPDKGTTFKVYLPVSAETQEEQETAEKTSTVSRGSETILLAEDDEIVRKLALTVLEQSGYTVLVAENGTEALQTLQSHNGPLHLLLTDVVMPKMNGRELFNRVVEKYPSMKVLYMSGYTDDVIDRRGVLNKGVAFIQKPFNVNDLAAKVREVLDS